MFRCSVVFVCVCVSWSKYLKFLNGEWINCIENEIAQVKGIVGRRADQWKQTVPVCVWICSPSQSSVIQQSREVWCRARTCVCVCALILNSAVMRFSSELGAYLCTFQTELQISGCYVPTTYTHYDASSMQGWHRIWIEKKDILQSSIIMLLILLEQPLQRMCACEPLVFGPYLGETGYGFSFFVKNRFSTLVSHRPTSKWCGVKVSAPSDCCDWVEVYENYSLSKT